jgi:hypothetical protein
MPAKRPPPRPPMPKLPPFALADVRPTRKSSPLYLLVFFFLFAIPLFVLHIRVIALPFFWDEHGQFIPTALDILRSGAWVAKSTIPNVHPPGVEAVLALLYNVFGYSIPLTRIAMLTWASFGLLFTFLLAIELSAGTTGAPAFLPPLLMLVSPIFFMQSFMAQLDMPCMVLALLALLLFLKKHYAWSAVTCVALVLVKETGIVVPFVFFCFFVWKKDYRRAAFFVPAAFALGLWLALLHHVTGYWTGDPGFAHYNIEYALHPVRLALSIVRRIFYLFFAEMRVVGTVLLAFTAWKCKAFRTEKWAVTLAVSGLSFLLVTVLGGAELERYLLPVLPVFYIAVAVALTTVRKAISIPATVALFAGLIGCIFWNPPYPFPYENNYAMVDFVELQQAAGEYADAHLKDKTIASAWPFTAALRNPDFGFVSSPKRVIETNDFHLDSIQAAKPEKFDALITYTRTWQPADGVISNSLVRRFLAKFYEWQPDITSDECARLGLKEAVSWTMHGQEITVYLRQ